MYYLYQSSPIITDNTIQIISLSLNNDHSLSLSMNKWIIIVIILSFIMFLLFKKLKGSWKGPNFEIDNAEVGFGSGKICFKPNLKDQQIAYSIWVELSTRKIGLPIDLDHDVISEIYDSWHDFFLVTRELIKDIPVNKVKNDGTQKIIKLSIDVLNEGLRPHLTKWQSRFRHWYKKELDGSNVNDMDPQEIQAKYPKFQELTGDLLVVNQKLIKYREKMHELVFGPNKV
jgi:hypothetical protein